MLREKSNVACSACTLKECDGAASSRCAIGQGHTLCCTAAEVGTAGAVDGTTASLFATVVSALAANTKEANNGLTDVKGSTGPGETAPGGNSWATGPGDGVLDASIDADPANAAHSGNWHDCTMLPVTVYLRPGSYSICSPSSISLAIKAFLGSS